MSHPSQRASRSLVLALVLVLVAAILAPAAQAEDRGTLTTSMTLDQNVTTAGTNDLLVWRITTSCVSEAADCGNVLIQDTIPAGLTILDVDLVQAIGYTAAIDQLEGPAGPSVVTLTRPDNVLHGETITAVIRTQVAPEAAPLTGSFDHVATTASTNATPPTTSNSIPVQWLNNASWRVEQGVPPVEVMDAITVGANHTHRVAVCGPTTANVERPMLQLDLALPAGVVVVEPDGAVLTEGGLGWSTPEVTQSMLADEQIADLASGRVAEFCTEFFPIVRFPAADFLVGGTVEMGAALVDSTVGADVNVCEAACRSDIVTPLIAAATEIAAVITGPSAVSAGGFQSWTVGFDATAASESIETPILETSLPVGLTLHELTPVPVETGDVESARVYLSIDGGVSFLPTPLDTQMLAVEAGFGLTDFEPITGGVPVTGFQVRWYGGPAADSTTTDVLGAGSAPGFELLTRSDSSAAGEPVAVCAAVAASNAASTTGQGELCHAAQAVDVAMWGIDAIEAAPGPPTSEQLVTISVDLPIENGQPIVDPMVFDLLPAGFNFVELDSVSATAGLTPLTMPRVEVVEDFAATGRDLVRFHWGPHDDGTTTAHTINWTAVDMLAAGTITPASVDVSFLVASEPGTAAGIATGMAGIVSDSPGRCTGISTPNDDIDGLRGDRTGTVCTVEHLVETINAASTAVTTWVRGEDELAALTHQSEPGGVCPVLRRDDRDHTASPCAVHTVPNGLVQVRTEIQNTGNLALEDQWTFGLLPRSGDIGIDPGLAELPRESAWDAQLTGPVVVSGLDFDTNEPDDIVVEYSTSLNPCRNELVSGTSIPVLGCVDDWAPSVSQWSDVTAYRVHVPFDRERLDGGASYSIESTLSIPADGPFASAGHLAVGHVASSLDAGTRLIDLTPSTTIQIPEESDIRAASPDLLPHDLALIAVFDVDGSEDLFDGVDQGDAAAFAVTVTNQGSPVGSVTVAVHPGEDLGFDDTASGVATASDGSVLAWSRTLTGSTYEQITLVGDLGRGVSVAIPVVIRPNEEWAGTAMSIVAEIANFDTDAFPGGDAASGDLDDRDSMPDVDPGNDVQPVAPDASGDNVITGDGTADTGLDPDPITDDEDDHDLAAAPLWDLAVDLSVDAGSALNLETLTADWSVTVVNEGDRAAHQVDVAVTLPAGMSWGSLGDVLLGDVIVGDALVTSTATAGDTSSSMLTIDTLAPAESVTVSFSTKVIDAGRDRFSVSAQLVAFDDDDDPANDIAPIVVDWDQASGDQTDAEQVVVPVDVAVVIEHAGSAGLPLAAGQTIFDLDALIMNNGRSVQAVEIALTVPAGLSRVLSAANVALDQNGHPLIVTWDDGSPVSERASIRRADGQPMMRGTTVMLPIQLTVDANPGMVDVSALTAAIAVVGVEADGVASPTELADVVSENDAAEAAIRIADLAATLIVDPDRRVIRLDDGSLAARWQVTITNEGTLETSNVVVDMAVPAGMEVIGLGGLALENTASNVALAEDESSDRRVSFIVDEVDIGAEVSFEILTRFLDTYDGRFDSHIEIVAFEASLDAGDADSTPASWFDDESDGESTVEDDDEDDDDGASLELPVDVQVAARHVDTSGSALIAGATEVTFEIEVSNAGRPLREFEIDIAMGPATFAQPDDDALAAFDIADDGDGDVLRGTWTRTENGFSLSVVGVNETRGGGDPSVVRRDLDPGETVLVPLTLTIASDWDGRPLSVDLAVTDPLGNDAQDDVTVLVPVWDLALDLKRAPDQGAYLDLSSAHATWAVTVTNEGNQPAHRIAVAFAVPAGMSLHRFDGVSAGSAAVATSSEPGATGLVFFDVAELTGGDEVTFEITTRTANAERSSYTAAAEIAGFDDDADGGNDPNPIAFDADSTPNISVVEAEFAALAGFDPTASPEGAVAVNTAPVIVDEDDRSEAQVNVPLDLALTMAVDTDTTAFPTVAGSVVGFELELRNQGAAARSIDVEIAPDELMWADFDGALNADGVTTGDAALTYSWDQDAQPPVVSVTGELGAGQVVQVPLALTTDPGASASFGNLAVVAAVIGADDDGDPGTISPELVDVDSDGDASIVLDTFDLAATIDLDAATAQPVAAESAVTFSVSIRNQGTVGVSDIALVSVLETANWLPFEPDLNVPRLTTGGAQLGFTWTVDPEDPTLIVARLDGLLPAGATIDLPLSLRLAPAAVLDETVATVEVSEAIGRGADGASVATAADGSELVDFDSTADTNPANDNQPQAPGNATDGVTSNLDGDEDDHDIAGLASLTYNLGNEVWFDVDDDGRVDDDEPRAVGVSVELYADNNFDGQPDDRDLSESITSTDRIAITSTDGDGLYLFSDVAVGSYVIVIPASEFASGASLDGWSAAGNAMADPNDGIDGDNNALAALGAVRSGTIQVGGSAPEGEVPDNSPSSDDRRSDLTIDLGLSRFSIGNQLWFDSVENGIREAGEQGVPGALVHLFVDGNGDGLPDDRSANGRLGRDDALASMRTDDAGRYLFDGIGPGVYVVGVDAANWDSGLLTGWQHSRFSQQPVDEPRDGDSDGRSWIDGTLVSYAVRIGDGEPLGELNDNDPLTPDGNENLTIDFGFEPQPDIPLVWPEFDTTGFTNTNQWTDPERGFGNAPVPNTGGPGGPDFFSEDGPTFTGPDGAFGDPFESLDIFDESDEGPPAADPNNASDEPGDGENPDGPLAYSGSNARELVSWAAMLIVLGAALVGVTREDD